VKVDQRHLRRLLERGDHDGFVRALDPLCHREARRVAPNGLDYEDLVQEARVAVLKIARAWQPDRGANPLTLAIRYVRHDLWRVTGEQLQQKRRANVDARSLDAPASPSTAIPLGAVLPAAGAAVHEIVEQRDELRQAARRLAVLPRALRENLDRSDNGRSPGRRVAAFVAAGGQPGTRVVYHPRRRDQTVEGVLRRVQREHPGSVAVSATKRKLIDGRERAPQGRPTADGRLGDPVWRVELLSVPERLAA
jgi:DNA-directed RNA polymerase specialized sigma24 family protein